MNQVNALEKAVSAKYRLVGKVQGVGFRHFLQKEATKRGIFGWARNLSDYSLIVFLEGEDDAVNEMLDLMREGPATARVVSVTELVVEDGESASDAFNIVS